MAATPALCAPLDPVDLIEQPAAPEPQWLIGANDNEAYDWARRGWAQAAAEPGAWFDHAKADAVVAKWSTWFHLTEDRFAGKPFRLNRWQEIIVRLLVGWKVPVEVLDPDTHEPIELHVRLFKRMMLWVPRKNGKSEFMAALALLFWAVDGVVGGQGFVFARNEEQAFTPFNKMKAMIGYHPDFVRDIGMHAKSLYLKPFASPFLLMTGAEEGKHGKSPTVILGDEMHEWKSKVVMDTLRQGTGARLQAMELYASTAGLKTNRTGVELWEESLGILERRLEDPSTLVVIFAADVDDRWDDEAVWAKANPSLGLSPTIAFLRREARLAQGNPRAEAHFRCYHLNQWIDAATRWLSMKAWNASDDPQTDDLFVPWKEAASLLKGRRCCGAFDVSSTKDVTALVWAFPPTDADPKWRLVCRFWVPEDTMAERVKNDHVPYDRWVASGAMETTPGDWVDQNYVAQAIHDGLRDFEVFGIGYDAWNAQKLVTDLQADGVADTLFIVVRQGIQSLGEPSKTFERMIYAGQLGHGAHPVLSWMAGNAAIRFDENLNFMPAKKKSAEKIDGIVAAVMAVAVAMNDNEEADMDDYLAAMKARAT